MKRFAIVLTLVLLCATLSFGQVRKTSTFNYNIDSIFSSGLGTYTFPADVCDNAVKFQGSGVNPFSTSATVKIVDVRGAAYTETLALASITKTSATCVLAFTGASYSHASYHLRSGTCGLAEAMIAAGTTGTVEVDQDFYNSGCSASTITGVVAGAVGASGLLIHDVANGKNAWYGYNGSAYASVSSTAATSGTLEYSVTMGATTKLSQHLLRGRVKIDERPTGGTTEDYALQIRSESGKTSGTHWGIDAETHLKATGTAAIRGTQGVAVVDATYTQSGGGLTGIYGQARADGTFNAPAAFVTGVYGLIEEGGGAITASHVASVWADSHRNTAVTGSHELFYGSNNGTAVLDQMFYLYGDAGALFRLSNGADDGAISFVTGPGTAADGTPIKLKVIHNGTSYYINAYPTDH